VPEPEPLVGQRIVATPDALDALIATMPPSATVLRFAPDEALVLGAGRLRLDDPDAIVEPEVGFVAVTVDRDVVVGHTEWAMPAATATGQGAIAGVPAKLMWLPDGRAWVVTPAAYAADLLDRLR
jgi:hypothetical protein